MPNYLEKLKDPRWQKLRLKVFERDEWTCQSCLTDDNSLCVHHTYYEEGLEPWEYPLHSLVTLCELCHEEERNRFVQEDGLLIEIKKAGILASQITEISLAFHEIYKGHTNEVLLTVLRKFLSDKRFQKKMLDVYFKSLRSSNKIKNG